MLVRFSKNPPDAPADTLTCIRADGTTTSGDLPRQGILPRAAFHLVVESTLGWREAFFGAIARGRALAQARIASPGRQRGRRLPLRQARQCEALVTCLESEQWGGATDPAGFARKLLAACRRQGVPPPEISVEQLERVRTALLEFGAAWRPLNAGQSLERTFA